MKVLFADTFEGICIEDDFLIQYCQNLGKKDFTVKTERLSRNKKGKREYLNEPKTTDLMRKLSIYFEFKVEVPRIRVGKRQTVETLINEEALLLGKFLRDVISQYFQIIQ